MNPTLRRRQAVRLLAVVAAVAAIGSPARADDAGAGDANLRHGKIFMSTNAAAGNRVLVYASRADAPPTPIASVATDGLGTGAGLGSQGAVTLSTSGRYLFVVNAGSGTISTFELDRGDPVLTSVVDSGGLTPISVAENDGLVYVLNAGGAGNVAGFRNERGVLTPLADGVRGLSAAGGSGPAQVGFDRNADVLVVSEKNTNVLTSYAVGRDGTLGARAVTPSAGAVPFGFAITQRNVLVVSEAAASTVSSYRLDRRTDPVPQLVSATVANGQGAACWIAVTPDGRRAYSANASTSTISSYAVDAGGALTLLAAQAGFTGAGAGVLDMAVTPDGRQLHAFASRAMQIVSFTVGHDGSLAAIGAVGGLPAGAAGLAAN